MMPSASQDCISYFKRFRMELDLDRLPSVAPLPEGYFLVPWQPDLLKEHTEVLFSSFQETIDALVFPSLGDQSGCFFLMSEIVRKPGFLPGATWLLACAMGCIGSVQGLTVLGKMGAIQNLGIIPGHRGQGLGTYLLRESLVGFRRAGLRRAMLEVTAQNEGAVRLYRRFGFRRIKTLYKAVSLATIM
jgi:ribosomal protein S18 acetylase RimI-like enzyme